MIALESSEVFMIIIPCLWILFRSSRQASSRSPSPGRLSSAARGTVVLVWKPCFTRLISSKQFSLLCTSLEQSSWWTSRKIQNEENENIFIFSSDGASWRGGRRPEALVAKEWVSLFFHFSWNSYNFIKTLSKNTKTSIITRIFADGISCWASTPAALPPRSSVFGLTWEREVSFGKNIDLIVIRSVYG